MDLTHDSDLMALVTGIYKIKVPGDPKDLPITETH